MSARKRRRYQSIVANIESGERRIDVVEFLDIAEAIGFDPGKLIESCGRGLVAKHLTLLY